MSASELQAPASLAIGPALAEFTRRIAVDLAADLPELPSFPEVVLRVRRALSMDEVAVDEVVRVVSAEPSLSVRLLQLSNSAALNPGGGLKIYPGSPLLVRAWLRPRDRLIACELEPRAAAALAKNLASSTRAKALAIDGWTALQAYLPPTERRGLVLIDPPYEAPDEFARLAEAFGEAQRKWASGIYLLWYPIKDKSGPDALAKHLKALRIGKVLRAEMTLAPVPAADRLLGTGLIIVNPPWTLERELAVLLPALADCLAPDQGGFRLDWLAREI